MCNLITLKDFSLSFDSFEDDSERYYEELINRRDEIKLKKDQNIFNLAMEEVHSVYFKRKLWVALSESYTPVTHYQDSDTIEICNGLINLGEYHRLKNMWKPYLYERLSIYWDHLHNKEFYAERYERDFAGEELSSNEDYLTVTWPNIREEAIGALATYAKLLNKMNDTYESVQITELINSVKREILPEPKHSKPVPTKMNSKEFWRILELAKNKSSGDTNAVIWNLSNILEKYKATEIKKFQQIMEDKIEEIYTWDAWALIYIAQDGCSDDGFQDFRNWVVLQGEKIYSLVLTDINKSKSYIPCDGSASCPNLSNVAGYAYMIRSGGKPMTLRKNKRKSPNGDEWGESTIDSSYPKLSAYFIKKKKK